MTSVQSRESSLLLTVENGGAGNGVVHQLAPGRSVLVGTSKDCGLRLQGQGLSPCHCLLSLEDGTLWVQDWASTTGTLLNGKPIEAKVAVEPGDDLRVGDCRISSAFATSAPFGAGRRSHPSPTEPPAIDGSSASHAQGADRGSHSHLAEAGIGSHHARTTGTDPDTAAWPAEEFPSETPGHQSSTQESFEQESFEQETITLLREEIDLLQGMLAERDSQIAELSAGAGAAVGGEVTDCELEKGGGDSEVLLARMEQLLEEAACGDERVVVLEEMLRASEEANQAEQEERQQLEAWVADIERRIAQRDDQRSAEFEALRGRLDEAVEERERAQLQLKQAASAGNAPKYYEESLDRLQHQNKQLQEKLAEMAAERATLTKRLENSAGRHDEATRQERAAIAQERAVVSRLRCELANKLSALEDSPKPAKQAATDAATRLQALREHLREIHVEEQQGHQERPNTTLTGRITRIWRRLEN